jgi:hypothetical protein
MTTYLYNSATSDNTLDNEQTQNNSNTYKLKDTYDYEYILEHINDITEPYYKALFEQVYIPSTDKNTKYKINYDNLNNLFKLIYHGSCFEGKEFKSAGSETKVNKYKLSLTDNKKHLYEYDFLMNKLTRQRKLSFSEFDTSRVSVGALNYVSSMILTREKDGTYELLNRLPVHASIKNISSSQYSKLDIDIGTQPEFNEDNKYTVISMPSKKIIRSDINELAFAFVNELLAKQTTCCKLISFLQSCLSDNTNDSLIAVIGRIEKAIDKENKDNEDEPNYQKKSVKDEIKNYILTYFPISRTISHNIELNKLLSLFEIPKTLADMFVNDMVELCIKAYKMREHKPLRASPIANFECIPIDSMPFSLYKRLFFITKETISFPKGELSPNKDGYSIASPFNISCDENGTYYRDYLNGRNIKSVVDFVFSKKIYGSYKDAVENEGFFYSTKARISIPKPKDKPVDVNSQQIKQDVPQQSQAPVKTKSPNMDFLVKNTLCTYDVCFNTNDKCVANISKLNNFNRDSNSKTFFTISEGNRAVVHNYFASNSKAPSYDNIGTHPLTIIPVIKNDVSLETATSLDSVVNNVHNYGSISKLSTSSDMSYVSSANSIDGKYATDFITSLSDISKKTTDNIDLLNQKGDKFGVMRETIMYTKYNTILKSVLNGLNHRLDTKVRVNITMSSSHNASAICSSRYKISDSFSFPSFLIFASDKVDTLKTKTNAPNDVFDVNDFDCFGFDGITSDPSGGMDFMGLGDSME